MVRRPATFRGRLTASITAWALVVLAATGTAIYVGVRHTLRHGLDQALLAIARTEIASEFDQPDVGVHVHPDPPSALTLSHGSGYEKFARITDRAGRVLATTPNLGTGPALTNDDGARARALAGVVAFADLARGGAAYRGVYYPVTFDGAALAALVALPTEPVDRALRAMRRGLVFALAIAAGVVGLGSARLARRLTRPLERIAEAARSIPSGGPGARIPSVSSDAELQDVVGVLNGMLAALEHAILAERQATAAQRRFASDAAHELRSPLTNLRGTIEVTLRQPRSGDDYREALAIAGREIERLCRLAEDLLLLSRAEAGQLACRPAPCDLAALASQAIATFAERAATSDVRLTLQVGARASIVADADRLRQVLDNLLDNALRYAPRDSELTVDLGAANGHATIAVRDQGPGLTDEQRAHVFDRFYRADDARARDSGGVGLGLAIAKAIVEAHHGTLAVESAPGAGAIFLVTLPRQP